LTLAPTGEPTAKTEQIDGATRLYVIIGDPISAVRSPQFFNALFAEHGINAVLVALHVDADGLDAAWAGLKAMRNLAGVVVTMPHKVRAAALVDALGPAGQIAGAINAARREPDGRWLGDMFDGRGFVDGLRAQGHEIAGRKVHLLGLGGAGTAIAVALAEGGVSGLVLQDVDAARRDRLVDRIATGFPNLAVTPGTAPDPGVDAAINATPLGMKVNDPLPFDPATLPRSTLVVDIITKPEMTPLLERAAATGHRVHAGGHMHRGQALCVARFFGFC